LISVVEKILKLQKNIFIIMAPVKDMNVWINIKIQYIFKLST